MAVVITAMMVAVDYESVEESKLGNYWVLANWGGDSVSRRIESIPNGEFDTKIEWLKFKQEY